jgi:AraC-like DNA-binding protein
MIEIFQNIRKIYDFVPPCEELAAYVEFFAESSVDLTRQYFPDENFTVKMFASWTPTFYINLGAPYYINLDNRRYLVKANEDILILRNGIVERCNQPTDNIFTVKFFPGGLEAILGISQLKMINKVINLRQLLPHSLLNALKQPISFEERVQLTEQFLLSAYQAKTDKDHYITIVNDAISDFEDSKLQLNTSAVAERLFISSKTINRYFNRVVGISPKSYFSILRARTALSAYVIQRKPFVPFDYGYYDPSHFYKDVAKFTGQKLSAHQL